MFLRSVPYFITGLFYNDITHVIKELIGPAPKMSFDNLTSDNVLQFIVSAIPPALDQASGLVTVFAMAGGTVLLLKDSMSLGMRLSGNRAITREEAQYDSGQRIGALRVPAIKAATKNVALDVWDKWEKKIPKEQLPIFSHLKKLIQGLQTMDLTSEQQMEVDSLIINLDETITLYHKGHSITKTLQSDDYELQKTLESQLHVLTQAATDLAATINREQLSSLQAHSLFLNERYQPLQLNKTVNLKK